MPLLHSLTSTTTTLLLILLLLPLLRIATAAPPPLSPCSDELETFSVCLPFLSTSAINTPPIECCDGFASEFSFNHSSCLCHIVTQPIILGFTINSSRLFSLASQCIRVDSRFRHDNSRASLCPGAPTLQPLHSITDPGHESPKSHPKLHSSLEPNSEMPTSTSSSTAGFVTNACRWVPLSVIIFFTYSAMI